VFPFQKQCSANTCSFVMFHTLRLMTVAEIAYCYMAIECCVITHTPIFDNVLSSFEV